MSATEVIEEIKQLPPEEQRKVVDFLRGLELTGEVSEDFKRIAKKYSPPTMSFFVSSPNEFGRAQILVVG